MAASILQNALEDFHSGKELSAEFAEPVLDALITEEDESVIADVLRAWDRKGIEENEIFEIARILRSRMKRVNSRHETFVDIVGTGGSRAKTFNVSTAAAFVVAGAGVPVAKHGNKAATSNSGSADVLSELGINAAADPATAERCLNEIGICFMFAPNHHRLSPTLGKVRRGLGFPTIFNCVGPLCNPASAPHQLIGVRDKELVPKMANALARLGTNKSWVVHGQNGLDEISISGITEVAEIGNGKVNYFQISPRDCGLSDASINEIRTGSAADSAALIRSVLSGEFSESVAESIVLVNAMAAFYLTGRAESIGDGLGFAMDSVRNGLAKKKLDQLREAAPA